MSDVPKKTVIVMAAYRIEVPADAGDAEAEQDAVWAMINMTRGQNNEPAKGAPFMMRCNMLKEGTDYDEVLKDVIANP